MGRASGRGAARRTGGRAQTGAGVDAPGARGQRAALPKPLDARELRAVYDTLMTAYGPQDWWPAAAIDGPERSLEICVGAILVQNTWWSGAEEAIANLRAARLLSCEAMLGLPEDALAELLRPAGYFRTKARKLRTFCGVVMDEHGGDIDPLLAGSMEEVRARLLAIWGVGPETADAMTLYAGGLPTFVVDAYTYRLFERLGRTPGPRKYDVYRDHLMRHVDLDERTLNEWHALIVRHGQQTCRKSQPHCGECPLLDRCAFGKTVVGS
ncbi:MAG: endonuclease III domain-containing protein [Dehalococcoidia bacterium]